MKRAYKLQEFVAHSADVNCVRIGKKSSRVVVTGGEDHKVNMWAIGKPNAIMSLSGHTSAVESVTFDASEALVVAGAASGTIKLWDLEEAKIVRTFTGHRSNCIAVDFHPFGEFFASGSLDTNLKIWDIRRKNCIHTYKGHTRGVNCIKFSPDGRWVVSGGEDNVVKLWDLTAGKLLHDFKNHEGQILCLDYHPHEFLLATGSADRTVKFWDLETFELIGSAGSEASGIRSMIFNPDGRTLLAGLHESMKVFSWEPLRCHDVVDVGWSKLADLNVHEGKLLGCSFNQNCVGIWVVDLSRLGPNTAGSTNRASGTGGNLVSKPTSHVSEPAQQLIDGNLKSSNVTRNALPQSLESSMKEMKLSSPTHSARSVPCTPQRSSSTPTSKVSVSTSSTAPTYVMTPKRTGTKVQPSLVQGVNRPDTAPPAIQRPDTTSEPSVVTARPSLDASATTSLKLSSGPISSKSSDFTKADNSIPKASSFVTDRVKVVSRDGRMDVSPPSEQMVPADKGPISHERSSRSSVLRADSCNGGATCVSEDDNENMRWLDPTKYKRVASGVSQRESATRGASVTRGVSLPRSSTDDRILLQQERYTAMSDVFTTGHIQVRQSRIFPMQMEKKDRSYGLEPQSSTGLKSTVPDMTTSKMRRGGNAVQEKAEVVPVMNEEDVLDGLLQQHSSFCNTLKPRLTKLQVVKRFWIKNDIKGSIEALAKMADNSVVVDVANIITDKSDVLTLEVCTLLLPLLNGLLSSELDRYSTVAISLLLLIVKAFGPVIRTTRSASPCFGVDLHAEERFERCNECYVELQAISQKLAPLLRRGGDVGKQAQDLSIAIQEV